jgi:hypothetical protein
MMHRRYVPILALVAISFALASVPTRASAFCGFYVGGADAEIFNNATMVVLMREGRTTVLSMQNDYQGPPEDFAMVVPVPVVLREENVKTLPRDVFERVDRLAAPRLVEYWEEDPCAPRGEGTIGLGNLGTIGHGAGAGSGYGRGAALVRVEAEFTVGEYEIVILSADDSSALDTWLREHRYRIPEGAAEALRPYVEGGMKFFVAKVDVSKVRFEDGRAVLSPLRVHYDTDDFSLPVRLGMLNSSGTQDLIVHVLAHNQRYEVANYPNVTIPTNIDVSDETRARFGEFYAALFDHTVAANEGAVVTEYAWQATGCDPCPGPVLTEKDLMTLGADVAQGTDVLTFTRVRESVSRAVGPLAPEIVRRIARRHINEVRYCHERTFAGSPLAQALGSVVVHATISETGAVQASEVTAGLENEAFRACARDAVRRWSFPSGDAPTVVDLDFRFESGASGPASMTSFVLTRLHYRYRKGELGDDLVFRVAPAITGGREQRMEDGKLEETATEAMYNNFQGRYAIRHPWEGPIACENPVRGVWGGPPSGDAPATAAATGTASAPRGNLTLADFVRSEVPGLDLGTGVAQAQAASGETVSVPSETTVPAASSEGASSGCAGCAVSERGRPPIAALFAALGVVGLAVARGRRRGGRS